MGDLDTPIEKPGQRNSNRSKLPPSAAYCSPGTSKSKAWGTWSWGKFPPINEDVRVGSLVLCLKAESYLGWAVLGLSPFPTGQRNRQCVQWGVGQHTTGTTCPGLLFFRENNPAHSILAPQQAASSPALVLSCDCFWWGGKVLHSNHITQKVWDQPIA